MLIKIEYKSIIIKKINLDKRMLEAYYAVLDRLQTYNQQKQLERAKAEQGKFLDIEVK